MYFITDLLSSAVADVMYIYQNVSEVYFMELILETATHLLMSLMMAKLSFKRLFYF